jgi:hypothetical protein
MKRAAAAAAALAILLATAPAVADQTAIQDAQKIIRAKLLDPDSARFSDVRESTGIDLKNNRVNTICGKVNSKNRMGGYDGDRFFYVIGSRGYIHLGVNVSQDVVDQFVSLNDYNRFCGN